MAMTEKFPRENMPPDRVATPQELRRDADVPEKMLADHMTELHGNEWRIVNDSGETLFFQDTGENTKVNELARSLKKEKEIFVDGEERTVPTELFDLIIELAAKGDIKKIHLSESPDGELELRDAEQKDYSEPPIRFTIKAVKTTGADGKKVVTYEARNHLGERVHREIAIL